MKALRFVALIAAVVALLSLAGIASASDVNTSPTAATYIDGQTHPIGADAELWYRFDYSGDNSAITIKLINGDNSGMGFKVLTPTQIAEWWGVDPIGRGTPDGNDLLWIGSFNGAGTYYVQLSNTKPYGDTFQLTIAGSGVMLGAKPIAASEKPLPVAAPEAAPGLNVDPNRAAGIDNKPSSIKAGGSLWYRFEYGGADHPLVTLTLVNGTLSGVGFNVYTAEAAASWWDTDPVGRGTTSFIDCAGGPCASPDLTWVGRFNTSGIYYVQIVNDNDSETTFNLKIE